NIKTIGKAHNRTSKKKKKKKKKNPYKKNKNKLKTQSLDKQFCAPGAD
ncbi:unnamed protein product, partial [Staurois parvus]